MSPMPRLRTRALFGPLLAILLAPSLVAAQPGNESFGSSGSPSWEALRSVRDVDTSQVGWLQRTLDPDQAGELFRRVGALSRPDAAQLLASRFLQDPSFHARRAWDGRLDSVVTALSRRPPPDTAGWVHVAYHVQMARHLALGWMRRAGSFTPRPLTVESAVSSDRLRVRLDFGPALWQIRVIAGEVDAPVASAVDDPVFLALFSHRSQRFYAFGITAEVFVENLRLAASDSPVDALYRYAFPQGLMHFSDVRSRVDSYRALVDTLSGRAGDLERTVSGMVGPYVPEGHHVERVVHFLFADGADGWAADGIAGIDLEYFLDDYRRLLDLLAHETVHVVQAAVALPDTSKPVSEAEALLDATLATLLGEGVATHIAPPRQVDRERYLELVAEGTDILDRIHDALHGAAPPDFVGARELLDAGVRGSGPLYWLGAEMARRIETELGRDALAGTLLGDGAAFVRTYLHAVGEGGNDLLGPKIVAAVTNRAK